VNKLKQPAREKQVNIIGKPATTILGIMGIGLLIVTFMFAGTSWAQQAAPAPEQPKVKVKAEPAEERPKEELKSSQEPGYFPSIVPYDRKLTLEIGPVSGILAPYGNTAALDTLRLGKAVKAGPLRVAPFLETDIGYRSNLFQTSNDKKATSVFAVNPGMYVELPMAHTHKISVGYLGNAIIYPGSDLDDFSHYDNNVNVDASFNFPGGLSLRAGNYLRIATEEPTAQTTNQRFYHQWTPYFLANYAFADRWKLQAIYEFNKLYFAASARSSQNDYNENVGGVALYYKILPKTAVLGQFIVSQRTYPSQTISNNYTYTPMVGLTWDATAKLSGIVKAGYTIKDFETDLPNLQRDTATPAFSGQVTYKFGRRTNLALTAQRAIQQDTDLVSNAPYYNTAFYVTLNHLWAYWNLTSYANVSYSFNDYINRTQNPGDGLQFRQDSIIGAGVGFSRPLTRYLRLRLDYSYNNKASNFTNYSYNEHRMIFGIQATM
jgi:hypothetical protein